MKRIAVLFFGFVLSFGFADGEYIGGGLSFYFFMPFVSVQAGFDLNEDLSLRGNLDSFLLINAVSADVLYNLPDNQITFYAGAGPDMIILLNLPEEAEYPDIFFGIHGTIGAEFKQETFTYYIEAQPGLGFLDSSQIYLRVRTGINLNF